MAAPILVIAEQKQGQLNRQSWETLVAGQQLAETRQAPLAAVLLGKGIAALAEELAAKKTDEVWLVEHDLLEAYTPDGYAAALRQLIQQLQPVLVLLPHTYQVRDFAPKLAASFQAGAFRADALKEGERKAAIKQAEVELAADQIRSKPEAPFREAKQAVDLSQAEIIVAVGRGIKSPENLDLANRLAALLGAEVGASRPICDEGWLPMERQIGSSGQTVAPKLYLALGISGAIQHVVGMKGARTVVAVNKDANAPIFEVADYGIVGDLFEVVPALIEALEKSEAS